MKLSNLQRGEWISLLGGVLIAVSTVLPWYSTSGPNASIDGKQGDLTAFDVFPVVGFLFVLQLLAPLLLAVIVAGNYKVSWQRGEITAIIAMIVLTIVFYNGVIDRPGLPKDLISLSVGWFIALLGSVVMLTGALMRQGERSRSRKPPGMPG